MSTNTKTKVEWPNSGILSRAKKESPKDRDFNGSIDVTCTCCGEELRFWVSGWVKNGARGKFLSLALKAKDAPNQQQANNSQPAGDGIPF